MKFRTQKKSLSLKGKSGSSTKKSATSSSPKKKTAPIIRNIDRNEGNTKPQKQTKVRKSSNPCEIKEEKQGEKYNWGYDDYQVEDSGFERYGRPPNKSLKRNITREGSGLFESDINWKDIEPNEDD